MASTQSTNTVLGAHNVLRNTSQAHKGQCLKYARGEKPVQEEGGQHEA